MAFGFDDGASRPDWLVARNEVAVRVPDHAILRSILARTGPLFVTSANPHGAPTPRAAGDVAIDGSLETPRGGHVIVDGGTLTEVPSTLVNVAGQGDRAVVEREGAIAASALEAVLATAR